MLKEDKTKYKNSYRSKKYACVCSKLYQAMYNQDKHQYTGLSNTKHGVKESKEDAICFKDVGTQIELNVKDIYDAYILDLLNTNDINKTSVDINKINNVINDMKTLSDIKRILQTTNDKLDLILQAILNKKEEFTNRTYNYGSKFNLNKYGKNRTKYDRSKSVSSLSMSDDKQNATIASLNYSHQELNTIKSKYLLREHSTSNQFFIPPYNSLYNSSYTHFNYCTGFGPKYADLEIINNYYNPFIMFNNFKSRNCPMISTTKIHEISDTTSNTICVSNTEESEDYFADQE